MIEANTTELFALVQDYTELEKIMHQRSNLVMCSSTCILICSLMWRRLLVISFFYYLMNKFIHHPDTELLIVTWLHCVNVHVVCINAPILKILQII